MATHLGLDDVDEAQGSRHFFLDVAGYVGAPRLLDSYLLMVYTYQQMLGRDVCFRITFLFLA